MPISLTENDKKRLSVRFECSNAKLKKRGSEKKKGGKRRTSGENNLRTFGGMGIENRGD